MTIEAVLNRLQGVQRCGRKWTALCPAHPDRNPSLEITEGDRAVLLRCWSHGCTVQEIARALGLEVFDLFYDAECRRRGRAPASTAPAALTLSDELAAIRAENRQWRQLANRAADLGLDLWVRAQRVFDALGRPDLTTWTEADLDAAFDAVKLAAADLELAAQLDSLWLQIRSDGLEREHRFRRHRPERAAA